MCDAGAYLSQGCCDARRTADWLDKCLRLMSGHMRVCVRVFMGGYASGHVRRCSVSLASTHVVLCNLQLVCNHSDTALHVGLPADADAVHADLGLEVQMRRIGQLEAIANHGVVAQLLVRVKDGSAARRACQIERTADGLVVRGAHVG